MTTNVHQSSHPSVISKISQLRNPALKPSQVSQLAKEISSLIAVEAGSTAFEITTSPIETTSAAGGAFHEQQTIPSNYVIVPVLRSGLTMVDSFLSLLPNENAPIYHLGLFREKTTLSPVEYYNKLPVLDKPVDLVFVVDPVIATGGTADAVIQTLIEWGARKIVFCGIIASKQGIEKVSAAYPQVEFFIGAIDQHLSDNGYIQPGIGDIGDRLFTTN